MKVLYYLEPWIELGRPHFRLSTFSNHIYKESSVLLSKGWQVKLLTSEAIGQAIKKGKIIQNGLEMSVITEDTLSEIAAGYYVAELIAHSNPAADWCQKYIDLIEQALCGFKPDIIIAYETAFSRMLRYAFKDATVIDSTLGIFSRYPYPETFSYDPFGSFSDSALRLFSIEELSGNVSETCAEVFLEPIRIDYSQKVNKKQNSQILNKTSQFDAVLLLPLQVSNYFAFDFFVPTDCHFNSQIDYLIWVLKQIPENIGIFVTEHSFEPVIDDSNLATLRSRFKNFIYEEDLRYTRWPSQYLVEQLDGVITVSSSIGYQAAFYNKFLVVLGESHLKPLADAAELNDLNVDVIKNPKSKSQYVYFILVKYHALFEQTVLDENWFPKFLEYVHMKKKHGKLDASIFLPINDERLIQEKYLTAAKKTSIKKSIDLNGKIDFERLALKKNKFDKPQYTEIEHLFPLVDNAEVVSFDIFDTLLVRCLFDPYQLKQYIAYLAVKQLSVWGVDCCIDDFIEIKEKLKNDLLRNLGKDVEDIRLSQVYLSLGENFSLTEVQSSELFELECRCESRSLYTRRDIFSVYQHALNNKKRVILSSDMYLDENIIVEILEKNKITCYEKIFLSSSVGKLKRTGHLFDELISYANVASENILHIGDNYTSDFRRPLEKGLTACLIRKISDVISLNPYRESLYSKLKGNIWHDLQKGISAKAIYSEQKAMPSKSMFNSSPYLLGLIGAGPIILAFSQWLLRSAVDNNISHLYFLSRDGWYPKVIVEKLIDVCKLDIHCHYMLASRRLLYGASYESFADIVNVLHLKVNPCEVAFFLEHRFGLVLNQHYDEEYLMKYRVKKNTHVVQSDKIFMGNMEGLLESLAKIIFQISNKEKASYLLYLDELGFIDNRQIAIVDIGHNGTLQQKLGRLTNRKFHGFYFATFKSAEKLELAGHKVSSYCLEFEDSKRSNHIYCKNIGMFEFLFIPPKMSIIAMGKDQSGKPKPIYSSFSELQRTKVAAELERGIMSFCNDAIAFLKENAIKFIPNADSAILAFQTFLEHPNVDDIHIVKNVYFTDLFGGFESRYLLHPDIFLKKNGGRNQASVLYKSWWRSGALTGLGYGDENNAIEEIRLNYREKYFQFLIRPFIIRMGKGNDLIYFNASPRLFFLNLNNKFFRIIGRIFFGGSDKKID